MSRSSLPFPSHRPSTRSEIGTLVALAALLALGLLVLPASMGAGGALQAQEAAAQPAQPDTEAGRLTQQAIRRLEAGDLAGALELLEPVRQQPDATPLQLSFLGALYVQAGRGEGALAVLEPLAEAEDADPAVLYNAGRAALATSQGPKAEAYFLRSIAGDPTSPAARELGLLYATLRQRVEAYKLLRPWAARNPQDLESRLAAALLALQLERPAEAEPLLQGLSLEIPRVRLLNGWMLLSQGEPYGTIDTLEPLVAEHPEEMAPDLFRLLAQAYLQTGRAADAAKALDGRIGTNPGAALLLASALYQSGETDRARQTLQPFVQPLLEMEANDLVPNPTLEGLLVESSRLAIAAGDATAALPALERATAIAPENPQSWQLYGQALAAAGRRAEADEALDRFRQAQEESPSESAREGQAEAEAADPVRRSLRRAMEAVSRGQVELALSQLRQESELSPGDPRPVLLASRILLTQERSDEALDAAERALAIAPELADAHYQRGVVHMAAGDTTAAEADFRRALELAPEHTATMNDLAILMIQEGRRDEARQLLERVVVLMPDDPVARQNLERLRSAGGGG